MTPKLVKIVGHIFVDLDCVLSMIALTAVLRYEGYIGKIEYLFIPQGYTYNNIRVDPRNAYETLGDEHVYHVDTGMGLLDHHRLESNAQSSLAIIAGKYKLVQILPEWERLVEWANLQDQGEYSESSFTLPQIILGLHTGWNDDHVLSLAHHAIQGLLSKERARIKVSRVPKIQHVDLTHLVKTTSDIYLGTMKVGKNEIGYARIPSWEFRGPASYKLGRSTVKVVEEIEKGYISIYSGDNVDLKRILAKIREAESHKRGLQLNAGMLTTPGSVPQVAWYAMEKRGRITTILHGSEKTILTSDQKTRLTIMEVLAIICNNLT